MVGAYPGPLHSVEVRKMDAVERDSEVRDALGLGTRNWILVLLVLLVIGSSVACTHPMQVRRYGEWAHLMSTSPDSPELARPTANVAIGKLEGPSGDLEQRILSEIDSEIRSTGRRGRGSEPVTVDLMMETDFSADGLNYLIAFPGFVIFTPAWNGFQYYMTYEFTATYHIPESAPQVEEFSCGYKLNHCSFGRGFATIGAGWLLTWASPLIAGFFYITYDDWYTPVFLDVAKKEGDDVARYAVHKIYEGLNRLNPGP